MDAAAVAISGALGAVVGCVVSGLLDRCRWLFVAAMVLAACSLADAADTPDRPRSLLFVTADWCGACQQMKPVVERVAKRHSVRTLDWDRDREEVRKWKVRLLPTFIAVNRGKEIARAVGIMSEERLERMCKGSE